MAALITNALVPGVFILEEGEAEEVWDGGMWGEWCISAIYNAIYSARAAVVSSSSVCVFGESCKSGVMEGVMESGGLFFSLSFPSLL